LINYGTIRILQIIYKIMCICYTNPTTMSFYDQIMPYVFRYISLSNGQNNTPIDLYASSISNWPLPQQMDNIDFNKDKVICNSYDTKILWKTNYFDAPIEDFGKYLTKMTPFGEVYVFNVYLPKYSKSDGIAQYNQQSGLELIHRYDLETLAQIGLICTCGNQETMQIGQVLILQKDDNTNPSICCGYNDLSNILDRAV